MKIDKRTATKLINEKLSLEDLLLKHNPSARYSPSRQCFCPFHDNTDTPSAAYYNNDGDESLYCFSERKTYKAADAVEKLLNLSIEQIGQKLFDRLSPQERDRILEELNETNQFRNVFSRYDDYGLEKFEETSELFKKNKASFEDLIEAYLELEA